LVLALLYALAGGLHLLLPRPFLGIMPTWVPQPELVIALTGVAELAGAAGLVQPWSPPLRRAAGWGLAAYAVCVFPANIVHFIRDMARPDHGLGLGYHVPRMFLQPVLVWLAVGWTGPALSGKGHGMSDEDYVFDEDSGEWVPASDLAARRAAEGTVEVRDAVGNLLADGDQVTLIKDLDVKGAGQTLKRGTLIKSIRLTGDAQEIDCRFDGIKGLVLRAEFVRKR
jgi:protein PhnA